MAGAPRIIILSEQMRGQSFELTNEQYTIGRTEACDICIPDPTISGHHCTLLATEDGNYAVRDEGSTNGTRVNGVKLENEIQPLVNSDILQVGGVEMLFDSESSRSDGTTTQTVINLEDTQTGELAVSEMQNLGGNLGKRRSGMHRENKRQTVAIWSVIGVLAAAALVALVFLIIKMMASPA
jgi:pSer/pThr/pTyr-binding forkhead associated (FHA) protein